MYGTALKIRLKQTKNSGITNRDETPFRWRIWCPPIKEDDPSQTPVSKINLNTHLIRMWSLDYVFGKCVQHKVQIGPGEIVVKGRYHAYFAEMTRLMVDIETTGDIFVWMF